MRVRRVVAVVVLALGFLASVSGGVAGTDTGVRGVVLRGPIQPVCAEGVSCDEPFVGAQLVFVRGGVDVARTTTGAGGRFRVRLAPGSYVVRLARKSGWRGFAERRFVVRSGKTTRVVLFVDTGIR